MGMTGYCVQGDHQGCPDTAHDKATCDCPCHIETFTANMRGEDLLSWESQVCQYPYEGEPGVGYFAGVVEDVGTVHCLLYRDDKGHVIGILNYFDFDSVWQKPGDVNIWIHKKHQGEGVGKALWKEAVRRWNVRLENQTQMTPAGAAFAEAMLREGINGIQD